MQLNDSTDNVTDITPNVVDMDDYSDEHVDAVLAEALADDDDSESEKKGGDDGGLPPIQMGPELDQKIVEACQEVIDLKQDRKLINASIQEVIERMESEGIPRAAFKNTLRELEYTEEQRIAYDTAITVTRRAVGIPIQVDMFDGTKEART